MLSLPYLESRINQQWTEWFNNASLNATAKKNLDFAPLALFQALLIWNRQFSPWGSQVFDKLADFDLYKAGTAVLAVFLIFLISGLIRKNKSHNLSLVYCLGSSGFWAMMVNLEMVFAFQVSFGYIYKIIGLLIAVFMAGIALASALTGKSWRRENSPRKYLLSIEAAMVIFTLFLSWVITRGIAYSFGGLAIFIFLFFVSGYFLGSEFALCSKMYRQDRSSSGNTAGILYSADLLGGCLAGFLGGIWLLPILGIYACGLLLTLLKITSLALLKKNVNKG
jgi:spermidine synthase